jgi:UDP-glucose 4-epimerase
MQVVTGCAGFIGSHLAERLLEEGEDVVGIDNFNDYYSEGIKRENIRQVEETAKKSEGSFELVEGSLTSEKDLENLPESPETVFHNAAIAGVRNSVKNPVEYAENNNLGLSKLLDYFESVGQFIFASSSSVYGMVDEEDLPVKEDRELQPIAPYPQSKKHGEELVKLYSDLYEFDYTVLRYFTVYGPRQRPDEAFTKFIEMILNDEPVTIYGDGEQSRDFTHVEDIVKGNLKAMEKEEALNDTFNISTGRRITVNQMVDEIDNSIDRGVERKHVEQPEGDARHTHADSTKAKEKLGYKSQRSFEEGVKECIEWVQDMREKEII